MKGASLHCISIRYTLRHVHCMQWDTESSTCDRVEPIFLMEGRGCLIFQLILRGVIEGGLFEDAYWRFCGTLLSQIVGNLTQVVGVIGSGGGAYSRGLKISPLNRAASSNGRSNVKVQTFKW